ncbi:type 2 isopentenyl-diphosphate Delta-isomerase [Pyrococcus abyssi]|uniref:Isopentenyl-diphosphate delta-isomerase n=1 Tax=Pyrococcus abyssi (strain GE5 / Orsay) TaxID=272844 RepID=IDI2_PYRAB|nr:type 2 isopentenyl-diphosphate Delta-isomerase [Pyrococcus abyssi]Q9UZS9.1 RecName: Full=Isopentenyl-diphosphate delta-isomerase; Short=IPP isomerase; AltName: Full=Isopentenyl diphosphate:dimethylallyl diphosphate isomerase; AltName: Full=Isopentenyl pyrophosphate isomerase; AltName: Full=Type 2 isopentenyl diphosphate isomerase; Short=IDI-2 [Pyrococcus abyssi GE5]CAB49977.1 fnI isopentenyl-diphosphate delta-isomerase (IPP isomerase) (EC 5.3.3.2) [Pyrococcus abyssi GE5]CCE70477.1 TPA: isopen
MEEQTILRKFEHIKHCLTKNVEAHVTNGFEDVHLIHKSLPEIDKDEIDLSVKFLGRKFDYPIMITGMTGGTRKGEIAWRINRTLAQAAQELNIPLGLGSQRAMIEKPETWESYYVRDVAPDVFLVGNLGAPQFGRNAKKRYSVDEVLYAIEKIEADAIAIHMNPLQESIQPEGDTTFSGVLEALAEITSTIDYPVIAKETGAGVSKEVAVELEAVGVDAIDISGLGGTSWSAVEYYRTKDGEKRNLALKFWDWGIKTAISLAEVRWATNLPIIASGGMRDGITMAKALAMGASMVGIALPVLRPAAKGDVEGVIRIIKGYAEEIRNVMFLVGARNIKELRKVPLVITGFVREWLLQRIDLNSYLRARFKM